MTATITTTATVTETTADFLRAQLGIENDREHASWVQDATYLLTQAARVDAAIAANTITTQEWQDAIDETFDRLEDINYASLSEDALHDVFDGVRHYAKILADAA
jgi:hypothetical protein